jgi:hypothetical protein
MLQLGAIQAVVTDETGRTVASAFDHEVGELEGAEEVQLVLNGATSIMRPERGEEDKDFAFTIPVEFRAFRGVLHVEEDIQALNQGIAEATWQSALPALLILLATAPLAAMVARRILSPGRFARASVASSRPPIPGMTTSDISTSTIWLPDSIRSIASWPSAAASVTYPWR